MAWIELHQALATHRKTIQLCDNLGIEEAQAVGHLAIFWLWALDNAPDGSLPASPRIVAKAAMWNGSPAAFVDALVAAGFLEQTTDGYVIHDWHDYAGRLIHKRRQNAERMRNARGSREGTDEDARAENVQRTCNARAGATVPNRTEPNLTVPPPQSPPQGEQPPALDLIPPEEPQPVYDEHNPEPEFMHLWEQYGRVGERLPAYRAWKRMKAKPQAQQLLTDEADKLVKRYLTYCQHTKTPQKHLASWLNQEAYAGYRDGPDFEAKRAEVKRAIAEQQQREEREERRTTSEGRRQQGADMEAVI